MFHSAWYSTLGSWFPHCYRDRPPFRNQMDHCPPKSVSFLVLRRELLAWLRSSSCSHVFSSLSPVLSLCITVTVSDQKGLSEASRRRQVFIAKTVSFLPLKGGRSPSVCLRPCGGAFSFYNTDSGSLHRHNHACGGHGLGERSTVWNKRADNDIRSAPWRGKPVWPRGKVLLGW